ncbi:MAG: M48 family metallopeptidase [Desulfuromonadales bacterium]|nr:M48 family metallopeptidase [Desulfuromonadales bacterium]
MNLYGSVTYGKETIGFYLLYVERKTLEISVHPDGSVIVKAPAGTPFVEAEKKVARRAGWIRKQLEYFRQFNPRTPERHYVGGESHLYLGRQYRLQISRGDLEGVNLSGGFFQITVKDDASAAKVKTLLQRWYVNKAGEKFRESLECCWPVFERFSTTRPRLQIRRMQKRWGSLSRSGLLTLNTELIRAPRGCIDYVITHELCHLQCHDHGPDFYRLLESVMPDWEKRKHKLELALI